MVFSVESAVSSVLQAFLPGVLYLHTVYKQQLPRVSILSNKKEIGTVFKKTNI